MNIARHIKEHAILGIKSGTGTGGPSTRPPEFRVLKTSAITPVPLQLIYSITDNDNGTLSSAFDTGKIQTNIVEITDSNGKPVYNSGNIFTRTKVSGTIAAGGQVTLNVVPNTEFVIHYIYFLASSEYISDYTPDDIVTKIEADYLTAQIAKQVAFNTTIKNKLSGADVQAAIDEITDLIFNQALNHIRMNELPLETPNGSRTTFTIPYGEAVKNSNLIVFLGPIKYNSNNIEIITAGTQFRIINNDHIPRASDDLRLNYVRRT